MSEQKNLELERAKLLLDLKKMHLQVLRILIAAKDAATVAGAVPTRRDRE